MPLSQICTEAATASGDHFDRMLNDLGAKLRRLAQSPETHDFARREEAVHQLFAAAEREVLAQELQRLDMDRPAVNIAGQEYRRVLLRSRATYTSAVGPLIVERTLYRAGKARAVVPLELRAGIIGGHWTPLAARQASVLVAHLTPRESAAVLDELGAMKPSVSSLDRLPKQLSGRWEEQREAFEEALRASSEVPAAATTLAVSLDGVMAPMRDGQRQAKRAEARAAGRATKGPAGYREVGCGTLTFYNKAGKRLRTVRCARMPQARKQTLKETLSAEVTAALAQRSELRVVKLADGAPDNWSFLRELAPQAADSTELVDFFHAAEQLKAAFDVAYGETNAQGRKQYETYRHVLRREHGGVEQVIRGLCYLRGKHPRRRRIQAVLGYFRRHRQRMDYAGAAQRGLPIGSGVVEAACKTLVTERLKRSGMRWREAGGQAILTLRGWAQSDRSRQRGGCLRGRIETR